ncbi:hypothetical protein [Mucilaginibacter defluvii]|uniref:Uncharacterized protein n=1 Tax=Mucilaginibacter defluvii TaxID=1196019 RepID=A0ABP9FH78_9SPHI
MKYLTKFCCLVLLGLILSFNCHAQVEQNISKDFLAYNNLIANKDFTSSAEYIPEELFAVISKEQMITAMKTAMNNPAIEYEINGTNISSIGLVKKINNKHYSIIKYVSNLRMRFKDISATADTADASAKLGLVMLSLKNNFGADNVKLDDATGWFDIAANKKVCAISANGQSNWKFIVLEPKQRLLIDKVLPKEITATLN